MESNRWWEFYFIRYFVGSVLGSLVVMALAFHPESSLSHVISNLFDFDDASLLKLKSDHFWVILGFGVAFCYIASAPILVMHVLRAHINFRNNADMSLGAWGLRLIIFLVSVGIVLKIHWGDYLRIVFFIGYALVVTFQLALLVPAIFRKFDRVFLFYKKLANDRAKDEKTRKEFVESYRHLREHGNAFLIIFCELILGCALFVSGSLSEAIIVIMIWLGPTLPVWFIGSSLETKIEDV
ncbi:hypothetical protein [Vreelandella sulfidaeris]|uniref:hypothetical protein n=1 Tax=Vreelandella sulfidaeris TaxID=115553 RepID=UPI0035F07507